MMAPPPTRAYSALDALEGTSCVCVRARVYVVSLGVCLCVWVCMYVLERARVCVCVLECVYDCLLVCVCSLVCV
jgi:hypothetical protein